MIDQLSQRLVPDELWAMVGPLLPPLGDAIRASRPPFTAFLTLAMALTRDKKPTK